MGDIIWKMFDKDTIEIKGNDRKVLCVICGNMIPYTIMSDLKQHLIKLHSNYVNVLELQAHKPRVNVSHVWKHFKRTDCKFYAECNYCNNNFSYKTTVANLKKHLNRVHPDIDAKADVIKTDTNGEDSEESRSEEESNVKGE
ncbi:jg4402 [Pararge aegeria aegeria]|uniref:Jg4402 protein n=1 Tax=Pararge aegeria aegeria TaxID=348720 RepID=A0A8S4SMY6_9NEOP|nr:jg4402 [Pararge aegeria aegeria]